MITTNHSIKTWAEDDRPREKMALKGRSALSDSELLAILLGSGTRSKSAVDLAQEIMKDAQFDLNKLGKFSLNELKKFSGVGTAKAITLIAALELGRRRTETPENLPLKISSSKDVYRLLKSSFMDLQHEEFYVIGLNSGNRIIQTQLISKGGINGTVADGKVIFKHLIDMKATACIFAHNHPSGALRPSNQDISLTKRFKEFGKLVDISVLDHVIFTDNGYYSFSDECVMPI